MESRGRGTAPRGGGTRMVDQGKQPKKPAVHLEDLPQAEEELNLNQAEEVAGGVTFAAVTADAGVGGLLFDKSLLPAQVDYNVGSQAPDPNLCDPKKP